MYTNKPNEVLVSFSNNFPLEISTHIISEPEQFWHIETQIIFVLQGEADIVINGDTSHLIPEDILVTNNNQLYQIISDYCEILILRFSVEKLQYINHTKSRYFSLNSSGETFLKKYDYVRYLLAQFVKVNAAGQTLYKSLSLLYSLIDYLSENFSAQIESSISSNSKNHQRIIKILQYINDHYSECLTLGYLAEVENLSIPYLSSFFKKNLGSTFLEYYNEIRLAHAINMMFISDDSLESISYKNGFPDSRSFVSAFKKKYNCLPKDFRANQLKKNQTNSVDGLNTVNQLSASEDEFKNLVKYLHIYDSESENSAYVPEVANIIDAGEINYNYEGVPLRHTYKRLLCVGSAKQFLYQEVQDMIAQAQKEIGYTYVKFHGLLSDEMMVYTENPDGTPVYSFSLVDKVIDFLLQVNLKPLCQLSFMPKQLSSNPSRMVNMDHFNTAPPKDMKKWTDLVYALIKHFITRYGLAQVRSWLFCVWNEPDGTTSSFYWNDDELFFKFYEETYHTVKSLDEQLVFGTPSLLISLLNEDGWSKKFFTYCREHSCPPEFLNIHYYDNSFTTSGFSNEPSSFNEANLKKNIPLNSVPYAFMQYINDLKMALKKYHMTSIPIYLTEWNLTISHRDLINDTCFKACYLIKNLLENYDRLESFGYWCITDFIEELQLPNELYHGGLGMFTYNGIPKAHYNAFRFLNHLGDTMIGKGNGYFITKEANKIAIILYNYEHYSKLFASGVIFDMTYKDRYTPFTEMSNAKFQITFTGLSSHTCLIKEMFVNQQSGSSYDAWVRMGAQPLSRTDDINLLRQLSQPGMYLHKELITDGCLSFETNLAPLEVRLVEIELDI